MEATGSTGGHFDLPNDDNTEGEKKSTHLELQELYGGENVTLTFEVDGEDLSWKDTYQSGLTFEWIKSKVAEKLEVTYKDVTLEHKGNPVIDPFCIVDMGLKSGAVLTVKLKEGADRGYKALREQLAKESSDVPATGEEEDDD
eukprot:CAMPEP_0168317838 /NCGR_PEP_ID=MMETSP0213-20121227/123_1 /TAXON_ID=151035 /ORGANISM="Euplotes harpa, Strain FSP1.4" /LENGTH=142 /DNA_ID=CAMNT_0008318793 /DNA_START=95 /DNA_END=523 /DNA_ORIENTATION=-